MNPDDDKEKELSVTVSDNEWRWDYVYDSQHTYDYQYEVNYNAGPTCKVVWVRDGREYEKEYSSREDAIEKQKSLLIRKLPAVIKAC